ncbi:RecQ family ATP-dependent DNA helicase [Lutibacter sp. TH_r2]|uniref:RecQ family ATP-dependent DNA helicase n=1 Tax=Lutibacter sp. TH_r2 TaxID=3082083 RepID=UPI0029544F2A|nr:RecQ family ATP-dependent DNA helicase [Lutibacter sp. TH_r2]MDV7188436.1 RecQ family ATP-dependent DNA helicase [Lutibacter sp. TH_r2]
MLSITEILKKYWGFSEFREPQEAIIQSVLEKKDTLVLLPTGGGKSLCYQIPALAQEGICIVVSPLIALINDQVTSLQQKGIKAVALTSQLSEDDLIRAFDNLQFGDYKFLYLSPEKFQSALVQEKIKQLNVSTIAIDEAHCISEWGHDFRPSYLKLNTLRELKPNATTIALTATATNKVLNDIQKQLELENAVLFKKSFKRTNLNYNVIHTEDVYGKLLQLLNRLKEPSIVYTNNRKQTKEVSSFLNRNGIKSCYYHGGLSVTEKNSAFELWMNEKTPTIVATNAFGMGIDKANVRCVIHINIPQSIENYIQEAGRAGRDGKPSYAIAITNKSQLFEAEQKYNNTIASTSFVKEIYNHLNQFFRISIGELPNHVFDFSLQEFCVIYKLNYLQTFNAIKVLEREEVLLLDENYSKKSTLKFIVSNNQVLNFIENHPKLNPLINLILRNYGGIFEHYTVINEAFLSKKLGIHKNEVIKQLHILNKDGYVHYKFENSTSKLTFLIEREDNYTINKIKPRIEQQNTLKLNKLKAVLNYFTNNKTCRNIQLLQYFNEKVSENCNNCDICIAKNKKIQISTIEQPILNLLRINSELTSFQICDLLELEKEPVLNSLKILIEKNKIAITSQNKFKLYK